MPVPKKGQAKEDHVLAFLRVTLLGPEKSGKSSLVDAFVSNAPLGPQEPTTFPNLSYSFYKYVDDPQDPDVT